jgi:hypothetical protein
MSIEVTFDITEYKPQGFNYTGYKFNFKIDKEDKTIEV